MTLEEVVRKELALLKEAIANVGPDYGYVMDNYIYDDSLGVLLAQKCILETMLRKAGL